MKPNDLRNPGVGSGDRRVDGPSDEVDEGVVIAGVEGVGPAIEHMADAGVDRGTALRVLTSPKYHRSVGRGAISRVLQLINTRVRPVRKW
jgi:hypothetical protein